jgi:hypothetical protein
MSTWRCRSIWRSNSSGASTFRVARP